MSQLPTKQTKSSSWLKFLLINVSIAALIALILIGGTSLWLKHKTHHGEQLPTPSIIGMSIQEAEWVLTSQELKLEVIDSTFSSAVPLGAIVEQIPTPNANIKHGRSIYVIVNSKCKRMLIVPELRDMSYRQAENTLKQLGFTLGEPQYEPSDFAHLVLDLKQDSVSIPAGTRLPEGSTITLVIGQGQGTQHVSVPDLKGMSLTDARSTLLAHRLTLGTYTYDEEPTEENLQDYIVYSQKPNAGSNLIEGNRVDIMLSTNIEKTITADNIEDEEEFF